MILKSFMTEKITHLKALFKKRPNFRKISFLQNYYQCYFSLVGLAHIRKCTAIFIVLF